MKIKEQLSQDLKQSMIAGEKKRRDTIRPCRSRKI